MPKVRLGDRARAKRTSDVFADAERAGGTSQSTVHLGVRHRAQIERAVNEYVETRRLSARFGKSGASKKLRHDVAQFARKIGVLIKAISESEDVRWVLGDFERVRRSLRNSPDELLPPTDNENELFARRELERLQQLQESAGWFLEAANTDPNRPPPNRPPDEGLRVLLLRLWEIYSNAGGRSPMARRTRVAVDDYDDTNSRRRAVSAKIPYAGMEDEFTRVEKTIRKTPFLDFAYTILSILLPEPIRPTSYQALAMQWDRTYPRIKKSRKRSA